jgi:hypothetical protein
MRADLTLVGIWLPAGAVDFDLRYNPMSARIGLWVSGGMLLLVGVAMLRHVLRRRSRQLGKP